MLVLTANASTDSELVLSDAMFVLASVFLIDRYYSIHSLVDWGAVGDVDLLLFCDSSRSILIFTFLPTYSSSAMILLGSRTVGTQLVLAQLAHPLACGRLRHNGR